MPVGPWESAVTLTALRELQPAAARAPKPQTVPATAPTKIRVHRQPPNAVSTFSSDVAHGTAQTATAAVALPRPECPRARPASEERLPPEVPFPRLRPGASSRGDGWAQG